MRKLLAVIAVALTALFGAEAAVAQVKIVPKVNAAGKVKPIKPAKQARIKTVKPNVIFIPPSTAAGRAQQMVPNGKILNVKLNSKKNLYMVKVLEGNSVRVLQIPATP
jgi:hypothetical protein